MVQNRYLEVGEHQEVQNEENIEKVQIDVNEGRVEDMAKPGPRPQGINSRGRGTPIPRGRGMPLRGRGGPGRGLAPAAPASADSSKPKSPYILPDGKWCSTQTCHLDHDTRRPGTTCYRKSDVSVEVPQRVWDSPGYLAALDADRLANHQYHKLPGQPKPLRGPGGTTVRPALTHANANLCDPCVDEWGFEIDAALDESADDNGGAMSFMFDMGSPDYSSTGPNT